MPIFAALIIIALALYCFYKVRYIRTKLPMEKRWLASKSSIALGLFVCLFGINQLFLFQTTLTYVISTIFIIVGGLSCFSGFKAYKFFLPLAIDEAEQMSKHT